MDEDVAVEPVAPARGAPRSFVASRLFPYCANEPAIWRIMAREGRWCPSGQPVRFTKPFLLTRPAEC
jgi:hypothetical protein